MRIEIKGLEREGKAFTYTYEPGELTFDDEHTRLLDLLEVSGRLSRKENQIILQGVLTTRIEVRCDRCLGAVTVPVETQFEVAYITAADYESTETAELQAEDLGFSIFDGEAINLDELVREQVLLALPTRLLCDEECKGLCPNCGSDLNINLCSCESGELDPRWAALAALKRRAQG